MHAPHIVYINASMADRIQTVAVISFKLKHEGKCAVNTRSAQQRTHAPYKVHNTSCDEYNMANSSSQNKNTNNVACSKLMFAVVDIVLMQARAEFRLLRNKNRYKFLFLCKTRLFIHNMMTAERPLTAVTFYARSPRFDTQ